jgi:hypothetical protein
LKELGFSASEIASVLIDKKLEEPWIFVHFPEPPAISFSEGFHSNMCLHSDRKKDDLNLALEQPSEDLRRELEDPVGTRVEAAKSNPLLMTHESEYSSMEQLGAQSQKAPEPLGGVSSTHEDSAESPVRDMIEYLCGVGGVRPLRKNGHNKIEHGDVVFRHGSSATVNSRLATLGVTQGQILQNLEAAVGILQQVGGCCSQITYLHLHMNQKMVEMRHIDLGIIHRLSKMIHTLSHCPEIIDMITDMFPEGKFRTLLSAEATSNPWIFVDLATQFLSLALLSYSQGHRGPISPYFLDTDLKSVALVGSRHFPYKPCVVGQVANLSCLGNMLGQQAFVFQFFPSYERKLCEPHIQGEFHLRAYPEDVLDTWGPGDMITDLHDHQKIFAISIGGGYITINPANPLGVEPCLHWSRQLSYLDPSQSTVCTPVASALPNVSQQDGIDNVTSLPQRLLFDNAGQNYHSNESKLSFDRYSMVTIGAVAVNSKCRPDPESQMRGAASRLRELGTFPSYWEVSERQLGFSIQAGQGGVATLQFNQTWVKMRGITKKSRMLIQRALYTAELESYFGVQASFCTGIARRVRLRDLLADVLPAYVAGLITKPPLWASLKDDFNIIDTLRTTDLPEWVDKLDYEHQRAFENLIVAVLFLLQDTGVDQKGETFVIACVHPNFPFQCFKVPCRKENYWTRVLADSEEIATFAYMTADCLETDRVKCRGPESSWTNSTSLLWTAVSQCCQGTTMSVASTSTAVQRWTLKSSESYLLGSTNAPLLARVGSLGRGTEESRLVVSTSKIPPGHLKWMFRKGMLKPRRLRERRVLDETSETVTVLTDLRVEGSVTA